MRNNKPSKEENKKIKKEIKTLSKHIKLLDLEENKMKSFCLCCEWVETPNSKPIEYIDTQDAKDNNIQDSDMLICPKCMNPIN